MARISVLPPLPGSGEAPATTVPETPDRSPNRIEERLTPRLAKKGFCAVPSFLLANAYRLKPHEGASGLRPLEVLTLIQLLDHKWDRRAPFPTVTRLAIRMGVSTRTVRGALKSLEDLGLLQREYSETGGPSRYHLDGLFARLEAMMDEDAKRAGEAEKEVG